MDYINSDLLHTARECIQQGSYQQAWYILDQIVRYGSPNSEAYYLLSTITSDKQEQITLLQKALKITPDYAAARNMLADLQRTSQPKANVSTDSSELRNQAQSFAKESWGILGKALDILWKTLKLLLSVPPPPSPSNPSMPSKSSTNGPSEPFVGENNTGLKTPILAALSQGIWMTNEGIGYKFNTPSLIPFINKGEEYGYTPIQHVNAVEIRLTRIIPLWALVAAALVTVGIWALSIQGTIRVFDTVTVLIVLGIIYVGSLLTDKSVEIYSSGRLFVSVTATTSEREVKQFIESYLQLCATQNPHRETQQS